MQREEKRVRAAAVLPVLRGDPWLALCATLSVGFFVLLYAYGVISCRPGGVMWETILRYEGHGWPNMEGTWLALPLLALHGHYGDLWNRTCGGTRGGRRPVPLLDLLVCAPMEDEAAQETFAAWKHSFGSLSLMCGVFILCSLAVRIPPEGLQGGEGCAERRWRFYLASGLIFLFAGHGLLGGLLMLAIVLASFGLAKASCRLPLAAAQAVPWVFALVTMEVVFRFLGDAPHRVQGGTGVMYWSRLEASVCGEEVMRRPGSGTECILSRPFMIKGLCPWYLYRFTALKLISFSLDFAWSSRGVSSSVRTLANKPELVQRTETNLALEKYGVRQYLCYVFYIPTYATGPILSYNAFVSQVETVQSTYTHLQVFFYALRLIALVVFIEAFSVIWWYSQKLHTMSCVKGGLYDPATQCIFDDLSVWELFLATHVRLHYMWLSLLIIWRFGRVVALLDGIDVPENMLGCVSFNYTFEAFWRIWHSSMNRFMLRYLYNPIGGRARSWLAVPLVFGFVAYWHECTGFLTHPWWYLWALLNALGVTVEKALADSLGRRLAGTVATRGPPALCLRLLARGCGPVALIVVNTPALLFGSTPRFLASIFLRGWQSILLLLTLAVVFGCTAELVEALRIGPQPPEPPPTQGRRSSALPPPLPPPALSPRPSAYAAGRPSDVTMTGEAMPPAKRLSFEAERQDPLLVEFELSDVASSWASSASRAPPNGLPDVDASG